MGPKVEKMFEYKGFKCVILMQTAGHRTGYVGVPIGHKYYKVNCDLIPIYCHGGLTYSHNRLYGYDGDDLWWIGYDCAHYGDAFDLDTALKLFADDANVMKDLKTIKKTSLFTNGIVRTLDFCINECKSIVEQLISLEDRKPKTRKELFLRVLNKWLENEREMLSEWGIGNRDKARADLKKEYEDYLALWNELKE